MAGADRCNLSRGDVHRVCNRNRDQLALAIAINVYLAGLSVLKEHSLGEVIASLGNLIVLIPMLLNELQKRARENAQQADRINRLSAQMAAMNAKLATLEQAMRGGNRTLADASTAARLSKPN